MKHIFQDFRAHKITSTEAGYNTTDKLLNKFMEKENN